MFWALKGHSLDEMAGWSSIEKAFMTAAAYVYADALSPNSRGGE